MKGAPTAQMKRAKGEDVNLDEKDIQNLQKQVQTIKEKKNNSRFNMIEKKIEQEKEILQEKIYRQRHHLLQS